MDPRRLSELDALLKTAASDGGPRQAPLGLRRRIESRVRYVALQNAERRRFLGVASVGAFSLVFLTLSAGIVAWHFDLPRAIAAHMPGIWGHVDRAATHLPSGWTNYLGAAVGVATGLAVLFVYTARRGPAGSSRSR